MKKFFEKHDLVKLTLGMILICLILSWIVPSVSFDTGEAVVGDINRIGIFNFFTYGFLGMYYFTVLVAFVFVVGVFYQFLSKLGAYQKLTDKLAKKIKGKEILFSLIISFVFAALASIINEQMVLFAFIPFIITVCSKANMSKMISFITTFGAVLVGVIGSTISTKITGMNVNYLSLEFTDSLLVKIIFFGLAYLIYSLLSVLYMKKNIKNNSEKKSIIAFYVTLIDIAALCFFAFYKFSHHMIYFYCLLGLSIVGLIAYIVFALKSNKNKKFVKKNSKKEEETLTVTDEDLFKNEVKGSEKSNIIPLIIVLILALLVIILAFIPWTYVFEVDWFTKAYNWVMELNLFGKPVFSYVLSGVTEFGTWDLFGAIVVMMLSILVLKLCYKVSFDDMLQSFADGFKKVGKLVVVLLLAYTILEFTVVFPTIPTIVTKILGDKFNVFTTLLSGLLSGLFNSEYQYALNLVYYNFYLLYPNNLSIVGFILQATFGLMSFITPASALLFVGLSYTDVKYKDWFKYIWKFLVIMLLIIIAIAFIIK